LSDLENSEIVRHVLEKLLNISSRKTTSGLAVLTLNRSIKTLEKKYEFLKHIDIKDTQLMELEDPISVLSEIDNENGEKIGKALYDIIKLMNINLGEDAGHFFIKELKNSINHDFNTTMIDMGVDLGLMQLEFEINEMTKKL
jgi:hypothetical protein